jgi:hypothetical protein
VNGKPLNVHIYFPSTSFLSSRQVNLPRHFLTNIFVNMPRFTHVASLLSLASVTFAGTPIPAIIPFAVDGGLDG